MANFQTKQERPAAPRAVDGERVTEAETMRRAGKLTPNRRPGRRVWVIAGLIVLAILAYLAYWTAKPENQAGVAAQHSDTPSTGTPAVGETPAGAPPAPAATSQ